MAHVVTFYVNGNIAGTETVADGDTVDLLPRDPGSLEPFYDLEFAGWSTVNDPQQPIFFSPNDTVRGDKNLYAMFFKGQPKQNAMPIRSMNELAVALSNRDAIYVGHHASDGVYFVADPPMWEDNYGYFRSIVTFSDRSYDITKDGVIRDFYPWNMASFDIASSGTGYKLEFGGALLSLQDYEGVLYPAVSKLDGTSEWQMSFDQSGVVSLKYGNNTLAFNNAAWAFIGYSAENQVTGKTYLYHIVTGPQEYTNGYQYAYLIPNDSIYLGYNFSDNYSYNVGRIEMVEMSDGQPQTILYVLNGESVSLTSNADISGFDFHHWASDVPEFDGNTSRILRFTPVAGMTLEAIYAEVEYWRVTIDSLPDSTRMEVYYDDREFDWEDYNLYRTDVDSLDREVYLIRKGSRLPLTYISDKQNVVIDHWVSSDARYDGLAVDPLQVEPTGDMTLGLVLKDAEYWRVTLPRMNYSADSAMVVPFAEKDDYLKDKEEATAPMRHPWWNSAYKFNEECAPDGDSCVFVYSILKGTTLPVFALYPALYNEYRFDHWISSDPTVDGCTDVVLYLTPTADMTLDFAMSTTTVPTIINGDTIHYSDTATVAIDVYGDGSVMLTLNDEYGESTLTMDSAQVAGAGISSGLKDLIIDVAGSSTVESADYGIQFDGITLSIYSEDSTMLMIKAPQPLVGNGLSELFINARVVFRSAKPTQAMAPYRAVPLAPYRVVLESDTLYPALSGFSNVVLGDSIHLQEVWYGGRKGETEDCVFHAPSQTYGEVDVQSQSFIPATTLIFSDNNFYVDYLDGIIEDEPVKLSLVARDADNQCYDILGRPIAEPEQGLFFRGGVVWMK